MPNGLVSKIARNCSSRRRKSSRVAYSADTSRKTITTPSTAPSALRIGAPLSAIWRSVPSRATRRVSLARPTRPPVARTRTAGLASDSRLRAFTIRKTSSRGRPAASACPHPVKASATGFICTTRAPRSVAMTASPIERRVIRRFSSLSRRASAVRRASSNSWAFTTAVETWGGQEREDGLVLGGERSRRLPALAEREDAHQDAAGEEGLRQDGRHRRLRQDVVQGVRGAREVVDAQAGAELRGGAGHPFAQPAGAIVGRRGRPEPPAGSEELRGLVPQEDGADVGPDQGGGPAGDQVEQRVHVQLARHLLAHGLHGLQLAGPPRERRLRALALAQLPLRLRVEARVLQGGGGLDAERLGQRRVLGGEAVRLPRHQVQRGEQPVAVLHRHPHPGLQTAPAEGLQHPRLLLQPGGLREILDDDGHAVCRHPAAEPLADPQPGGGLDLGQAPPDGDPHQRVPLHDPEVAPVPLQEPRADRPDAAEQRLQRLDTRQLETPLQEGLQALLVPADGLLRPFALRDVLQLGQAVLRRAVRPADHPDREDRVHDPAVLAAEALLQEVAVDLPGQHPGELPVVRLQVLGVRQLGPGHPRELLPGVPQERAEGVVDPHPALGGGGDRHAEERVLEVGAELLLALPQRRLGALPRRDVVEDDEGRPLPRVLDEVGVEQDPDGAAARGLQLALEAGDAPRAPQAGDEFLPALRVPPVVPDLEAHGVARRHAEDLRGARVGEERAAAGERGDHDGELGVLDQAPIPLLALPQRRLHGLLRGDELRAADRAGDLVGDALCHTQMLCRVCARRERAEVQGPERPVLRDQRDGDPGANPPLPLAAQPGVGGPGRSRRRPTRR